MFRQSFREACKASSALIDSAKLKYYQSLIENSDETKLFKMVDRMLIGKHGTVLPKHLSFELLAEQFNEFFATKIEKLRSQLDGSSGESYDIPAEKTCLCSFTEFTTVSRNDTRRVVVESLIKSCQLDSIPTKLVKEIDILTEVISDIVNGSLVNGEFPLELKQAVVRPSIKKLNTDPEPFPNYRPISNSALLSKTIEGSAVKQMLPYLVENNLYPKIQSAYRKFHSTETALLKVSTSGGCISGFISCL